MAQHKYDLVTVPTTPSGPPRHHPWYKERLDLKYTKRGQRSGCLDGRKWTLLAGNMDDFRTGAPPTPATTVIKGRADPFPLVHSSGAHRCSPRAGSTGRSPAQRVASGSSTLHCKVGPRRQTKLAHLRQLEHHLLQNPLSLYPHLQDSIPDEVAEEVISMLEGRQRTPNMSHQRDEPVRKHKETVEENEPQPQPHHEVPAATRRIYRWPLRRTEEEVEEERRTVAAQKVISPAQEARVSQVTQSLVQWGRELGASEEAVDIDETAVKSLFSSDYESRPMATPECVVDVSNVPHELLRGTSARLSGGSRRSSLWVNDIRTRSLTAPAFSSDLNVYSKPRCVKSRYGAWYLPTSLWKLQKANEPLCDPRNLGSESAEELARQDQELDLKISQLHGAQVFQQYYTLHKPGSTLPSFLQCVTANTSSQTLSPGKKIPA